MTKSCKTAGGKAAVRLAGVATAAALMLASVGAHAGELKIPKDHPEVALDVPDGWSIDRSSFAVELHSPEKNSVVVASVLAGGKGAVDSWTKQAGEKLKTFGIVFDPNAKATPKAPDVIVSGAPETPKPSDTDASTSAFTTKPDAFTFSGAPSLKTPGTEGSNRPVKPGETSVESLTGFGTQVTAPKTHLPFKGVQIYGASLNGKPVDVQLLVFNLPADHVFVMMQESGSDDGRAVTMAESVRAAK